MNKLWRDLEPGEQPQPGDRRINVQHYHINTLDPPSIRSCWQRPYTPEPGPAQDWISLSERKPTEADADEQGRIVKHTYGGRIWIGDYALPSVRPDEYDYWLPLPKLAKPDPDKVAFEAAVVQAGDVDFGDFADGWQAALDYRDGEGKE